MSTVHWPIIRNCALHPRRVLAIDDYRTYRGVEVVGGMLHIAGLLESVCASDTVGIMLPTGGGFAPCALAAWWLGKTIVPLNYLLKKDELQYVIDDCGTDTVLTAGPMLSFLGYEPKVKNLIRLDEAGLGGVPTPSTPRPRREDDLAVILYTSGTSGNPKGVMLTHTNLRSNLKQINSWVNFTQQDTILGVLPQFHSFGLTVLTLLPLSAGIKSVYTAKFVPAKILRLIREHRPTILIAIPSMYNALLSLKDATREDFASLRYVVSGGEPLPAAVFSAFQERFGVTLNEGYGLTETSPVSNWCRPEEWRPHSVGMPLPHIDQRIVDPNTQAVVPDGTDGEVQMRGPNIMKGYYGLPAQTAAAFTHDGYFRTGDIGHFDADGHLFITGRLKEMLIIGGENVFPREIEEVLDRHPTVAASGVIGVVDPMRGEHPIAFVELKEGESFDSHALQSWCRERLAGYKVPREIRNLEKLPRNPTGKIMRRELKRLAAVDRG